MAAQDKREILHVNDLPDNALVDEAAEFFRCTPLNIRNLIKDNAFPNTYKIGKQYRIPKKDIISYMESRYGKRD